MQHYGFMRALIVILLLIGGPAAPAAAQTCDTFSGLPVPRFVSLKFSETRGRAGPSFSHPVQWRYQRAGLPMQVVAETADWRRVRDPDGEEVWMHRRTLTGRRAVWTESETRLRARPDSESALIALVQPGAVLWLERCRQGWCRLESDNRRGWAPAAAFWGVYAEERQPSGALEGAERACYRSSSEPVQSALEPVSTDQAN